MPQRTYTTPTSITSPIPASAMNPTLIAAKPTSRPNAAIPNVPRKARCAVVENNRHGGAAGAVAECVDVMFENYGPCEPATTERSGNKAAGYPYPRLKSLAREPDILDVFAGGGDGARICVRVGDQRIDGAERHDRGEPHPPELRVIGKDDDVPTAGDERPVGLGFGEVEGGEPGGDVHPVHPEEHHVAVQGTQRLFGNGADERVGGSADPAGEHDDPGGVDAAELLGDP